MALGSVSLIGLAVTLLLTGCVSQATVSEPWLYVPPGGEDRTVIAAGDAIAIIPSRSADCLRDALLQVHPTLRIVPPDEFRRVAFADQPAGDVTFAYPIPESQRTLLATQTFRDRIAPLRLRYLVSIGEEEESRRIPGPTGPKEAGPLPLGWTTSLTLIASVIDLKDGREVGPIVAGGEGERVCAVSFSLVPFSCSVETVRQPVCETLGERLGNYVAGKAPAAAPYEDASAAHDRGDYATALRLVRPLAVQGHAAAQNNLGIMYVYGQGVPQDDAEAMKWFRKAAAQGHAAAQNNLGIMYRNGQGVPQDYVQAYVWFNLAAVRFSPSETEKREKALSDREEVAAKMTPEQIAEAQRLAQEWKPK